MNKVVFKSVVAVVIGAQLLQSASFAGFSWIDFLWKDAHNLAGSVTPINFDQEGVTLDNIDYTSNGDSYFTISWDKIEKVDIQIDFKSSDDLDYTHLEIIDGAKGKATYKISDDGTYMFRLTPVDVLGTPIGSDYILTVKVDNSASIVNSTTTTKITTTTKQDNDVDVYDDSPRLRDGYARNAFLRKKAPTNSSDKNTSTSQGGSDEEVKTKTPWYRTLIPNGQQKRDNPNDVDVYDDTPADKSNKIGGLRDKKERVIPTADNKNTSTQQTPTTNTGAITSTPVQTQVTKVNGEAYSPVVQTRIYQHNELFNIYQLVGLGSAVLISDTQAITNAHVAIGEDKVPYYIELCVTYNPDSEPECIAQAKVIKYNNTSTDLALLEYSPIANKKIATIGNNPTIGDKLVVHGYPVNGGNSITISQGIVSGRQGSDYKIDAVINHGNSGGGAFDENGKLIGMPSYAVGDINSIGYIISADTITKFLNGTITSATVNQQQYNNFATYIAQQQSQTSQSQIDGYSYSLSIPQGYEVVYNIKHSDQGISSYYINDTADKGSVVIRSHKIVDGSINNLILNSFIEASVPWMESDYSISSVTMNGKTWTKATPKKSNDVAGVGYFTTQGDHIVSVLILSDDQSWVNQQSWVMNTITTHTYNSKSIETLLPGSTIKATSTIVPILGFSISTMSPVRGLYSTNIVGGAVPFSIVEAMIDKSDDTNDDSSDELDQLFEGGEGQIYVNQAGQRILVLKTSSSMFNIGLIGAASEITDNKQRAFVMVLTYTEDDYDFLRQVIGRVNVMKLGGTDAMEVSTINSIIPSTFFEMN